MIHFTLQRYNFFSIRMTFTLQIYTVKTTPLPPPPRWRELAARTLLLPRKQRDNFRKNIFLPPHSSLVTCH